MADFAKRPSELDFLANYSQAKSEDEKILLKKEYEAEEQAYWDWMDKAALKGEGKPNEYR